MDIQKLIKELTIEEKSLLVAGHNFMYTYPVERLGIPALCMADGPHGLRKQIGTKDNGISESEPATAFPTAVTTASSWNPENTRRMGEAIGRECKHYDVHVLLGPGANIKRNPLCGRNFEYFSEDPLLAGEMAAGEVNGIQSQGVGVSVKHFALNNSENYRFMGNSIADMRAIREIYLKVFERIVREAHPATMMCAYNQINNTYCSENKWLLTNILREEWGFTGAVMTDWGAMHDRAASLNAGLDLEMPGDTGICQQWILEGLSKGTLSEKTLNQAVENILMLIHKYVKPDEGQEIDWEAHHALAAEIAADSAVLLKNDGVLPLNSDESILVIGDLFEKMRYQGAGSSMIHPTQVVTPKKAFDERAISYTYVRGYAENQLTPNKEMIDEAVQQAKKYKKILVFAGLTDYVESEGCDRESMKLPKNQRALLSALVKTGRKIIVVLFGGSVVELPFADKVSGILNMFLPGQGGGTAVAQLLFGEKSPSGRLAETWPVTYDDVPFAKEYSQNLREVYKESVLVGYRYYTTARKPVRYPFGYGLSYTTFSYEKMQVQYAGNKIIVTCDITNTGGRDGAEVVQLYVKAPQGQVFKPEKELRAFHKVYLAVGEKKKVTLELAVEDLRYYHVGQSRWVLETGEYQLQVSSDSQTVQCSQRIFIQGEAVSGPYGRKVNEIYEKADLMQITDALFEEMSSMKIPELPAKYPITLESRFSDLQQTFMGRVLYSAVLSVAENQMRTAKKLPDGIEKENKIKGAMFLKRILESNSLIGMSMSAGTSMPYHFACGFKELTNGHLIKGIMCFCGKTWEEKKNVKE